jgi:isoleucyl-tRNA synthetase
VRKDVLYCDRTDSLRRRAVRTVLDRLHRCLTTWLAPVLVFTAEEAWTARFGDSGSVHLEQLPDLPLTWRDPALGTRMAALREARSAVTAALEAARAEKVIGSSLQAAVALPAATLALLDPAGWAEFAIVSAVTPGESLAVSRAAGEKCARCWRVLTEVGSAATNPELCMRCDDAIESGQIKQAAE